MQRDANTNQPRGTKNQPKNRDKEEGREHNDGKVDITDGMEGHEGRMGVGHEMVGTGHKWGRKQTKHTGPTKPGGK